MDILVIAIKVSGMVSNGWTFKNFDSVIFGRRAIAEHPSHGTKFFDNDNELIEWLQEQ
ncbi:hypothetical protein [Bacillus phage vB_BanS-Thrax2]|nr:hypothetical protein [Bacillus phage vB_BanS-Thrax2]